MYLNKLQNKSFHIYKKYKENKILSFILLFLSIFYFIVYKTRLILYKLKILKSYKVNAFVVSVGNITTGGTGKTPLTIELAKYFLKKEKKVAVLSRGYKRKILNNNLGTVLVSDGENILTNYDSSGDEPYLIAKKVPKALVLVNSDRLNAANAAIKLGANVLILDDGYQHLKLERNENILLLDGSKPFDNGYLLPRGNLREQTNAINRATKIIISNINNLDNNKNKINSIVKNKKTYFMNYKISGLKGINSKRELSLSEIKGLRAIVFCGIANPSSFLKSLKDIEINVVKNIIYPDHYHYLYDDIKEIIEEARKHNIENIITTEKDAIKIEDFVEAAPISFWETTLEINWISESLFDDIT